MEASQILKSTVHLAWGILAGVLHPRGHLAGDILGCHTAGGGGITGIQGWRLGTLQTPCMPKTAPNKESPQRPTVPR